LRCARACYRDAQRKRKDAGRNASTELSKDDLHKMYPDPSRLEGLLIANQVSSLPLPSCACCDDALACMLRVHACTDSMRPILSRILCARAACTRTRVWCARHVGVWPRVARAPVCAPAACSARGNLGLGRGARGVWLWLRVCLECDALFPLPAPLAPPSHAPIFPSQSRPRPAALSMVRARAGTKLLRFDHQLLGAVVDQAVRSQGPSGHLSACHFQVSHRAVKTQARRAGWERRHTRAMAEPSLLLRVPLV
jgi:hypothetical protein